MSLIDFPSIPIAPGVPDLRRSLIGVSSLAGSGVLAAIQRYDIFGLFDGLLGPHWALLDKNGKPVITPDSVVSFEYRGENKISSYPVEQGSFASYNKVAFPYDIRMMVSCGGQGSTSRDTFLQVLELMRQSTDLYDLATPDFLYQNVNLTRFDYRRQATNGVTLLLVDLQFEEVRVTATATYDNTAQASGAADKPVGTVQASDPSADQAAHAARLQAIIDEEFPGKGSVTPLGAN